jgi:regulator of sigma E protease
VREQDGDGMNEVFGSIWWLIVTIGVLVTFHEFGHYWVARRCGVKVIAFSVGFGRALWSRKDKHGTIFQIAMIPLGGYVKMLDERDQDVPVSERAQAFNQQSVGKRIAIIAAGPIANLILCLVFYWGMFVVGKPDYVPVIGQSTAIAAKAGLAEGDTLLSVDGKTTPTWSDAVPAIMLAAIDRRDVDVSYRNSAGNTEKTVLSLSELAQGFDQSRAMNLIGLLPIHMDPPAIVSAVAADMPASGQLMAGDKILSVGNTTIKRYADVRKAIKAQAPLNEKLRIQFERHGIISEVFIKPKAISPELSFWQKLKLRLGLSVSSSKPSWQIGLIYSPPRATFHYGPIDAIGASLQQTWHATRDTFAILKRLITGQASVKNVSGTITVAQVANQEASVSFGSFLGFLAYFSLSLCIMNLLPIPVLDGGHLLFYFVELITGRPVAERIQLAGQFVGLTLLVSLMILANYNDVARIFSF